MTVARFLALAAVLLAATVPVEAARQAQPVPEPPPFPQPGDRFYLSVRGPAAGGRAGFARVYADPVGDAWAVQITCGTVDTKTGKERIELQAIGEGGRDRWGNLAWTWTPVGGGVTGGGGLLRENGLTPDVHMAPPCPSGVGELSSGD
ncbi:MULTISPECIES: hypothetical protein [Methylobacterium]|uniref:Secreted protein n=2 Tax=Methylobacterium TaxID=407 RepID=A0ABQ4SV61_9HYPH|nr:MULTISPECIES: hypothetical protein [Methylobacterium]PIU04884.1 MAG: hypothetical protein COT56_17870 [Methylobacterium sp. CG09_land_8_20_14_0_10_71_15]PIU11208.1 MAG: hypothetical protein COT28_21245 [Methylobacterium sp. CG08_land_8_20_14_0_20_71_15]GBU16938.1 hypothetical protein AwMethylo_11530 [Methylobacterium sp.]GJD91020.1 hypothetical protein BHAOGJBA_4564 [Methylobacterium hispanicum]GJE05679.1 hypothetical protein AOPFMNJM_0983 [Methylobacterium jeotgali]